MEARVPARDRTKIPKRHPIAEDQENGVDHSQREQPGKFYAVALDDELGDAREQVRQCQSVDERIKRGDMFKGRHANRYLEVVDLHFFLPTIFCTSASKRG